jgi:beta-N-acetylhexosaminidase
VIRGEIGFEGVLVSDAIEMGALASHSNDLAAAVIAAGCDLLLHCTGRLAETAAVLAATPAVSDAAAERLAAARVAAARERSPGLDRAALRAERDAALGGARVASLAAPPGVDPTIVAGGHGRTAA